MRGTVGVKSTRPGGFVSYVGVPHGVEFNGAELFFTHVHLHGGPAPVRRYLPELIDLVLNETARWMSGERSRRYCSRERRISGALILWAQGDLTTRKKESRPMQIIN